MHSLKIDKDNVSSVNWEEDCFKYCEFSGIAQEGQHVTADFTDCTFNDIDWYWGLFNIVNFVGCKFIDCVFRGTSFANCRFVDCELINCQFIKDNLEGSCSFDGSVTYNCTLSNCEGFSATKRDA